MDRVVKILLQDGILLERKVVFLRDKKWVLKIFDLDLPRSEFVAEDLFSAQVELRKELELERSKLLCAGARVDVFPSGMSRSMAGAVKAYKTQLGKPSLNTDLVDIFDYAEPDAVATVKEQHDFHQKWIESLRCL